MAEAGQAQTGQRRSGQERRSKSDKTPLAHRSQDGQEAPAKVRASSPLARAVSQLLFLRAPQVRLRAFALDFSPGGGLWRLNLSRLPLAAIS